MLGSCYIESRIHWIARKLNIRAILNGKGLQRNNRQRIFHLTVIERISTCETQVVNIVILHSQLSSTYEVNIVRLINVKSTKNVSTLVDIQSHIHTETTKRRTRNREFCTISKIGKLNKLVKLIVSGKWTVTKYIGKVSRTQHIQTTTHLQIVNRSRHHTI